MKPVCVTNVFLIFVAALGLHAKVAQVNQRNDPYFDAGRLGEPPEEDPSPGAVESDIMLTDEQKAALEESKAKGTNTKTKRKGVANPFRLWPHNTIPYVISPTAENYEDVINGAIGEWTQYTCLMFVPANDEIFQTIGHRNYVLFNGVSDSTGCYSSIGYINSGAQTLNLADKCINIGTVLHEIGHTIGLIHEHLRPDRDDYLTIHYENVSPGKEKNLESWSSDLATTNNIPYDYASIMHFSRYYGSVNGKPTMEPRNLEGRLDMGQRRGLTRYDIKHVNVLYECPEVNECETLNPCQNGGSCVDEPGTYHCECPEGWRGLNCDVECKDQIDPDYPQFDCNLSMGFGNCVDYEFIRMFCPKSCGICAPYVCRDTQTQCDNAQIHLGVCNEGSDYFYSAHDNCQKTCGFCKYCSSDPCLNDGTCEQVGEGARCICPAGFIGENCQTPI